ncbi:hypothetical protein [Staphylococcus simulans]|uniref:hypothetical protein n=1 Tax=Staphylococcus simulans TaxID=1286 RepID=UPI0021D484E3|nr:hypothetical protein [Staphylococcus simulans]UXR31845.1 hypothetical protein MUA81_08025 [Staphylococcus simulans]
MVFNYTKQQLKEMDWWRLKRQLEFAEKEYNKMNNTPTKVDVGIPMGKYSQSWSIVQLPENFQKEAKQLAKEHMKKAIDLMQQEFDLKTKEETRIVVENSEYNSAAELRFNTLMEILGEENKREFMEEKNND